MTENDAMIISRFCITKNYRFQHGRITGVPLNGSHKIILLGEYNQPITSLLSALFSEDSIASVTATITNEGLVLT